MLPLCDLLPLCGVPSLCGVLLLSACMPIAQPRAGLFGTVCPNECDAVKKKVEDGLAKFEAGLGSNEVEVVVAAACSRKRKSSPSNSSDDSDDDTPLGLSPHCAASL